MLLGEQLRQPADSLLSSIHGSGTALAFSLFFFFSEKEFINNLHFPHPSVSASVNLVH